MTELDLQEAKELIEKATRRVRTPAGAKRYGVPIGTPIGAARTLQSVRRASRKPKLEAGTKTLQSMRRMGPSRTYRTPEAAASAARLRRKRRSRYGDLEVGSATAESVRRMARSPYKWHAQSTPQRQIESARKRRALRDARTAVNPQAAENARSRRQRRDVPDDWNDIVGSGSTSTFANPDRRAAEAAKTKSEVSVVRRNRRNLGKPMDEYVRRGNEAKKKKDDDNERLIRNARRRRREREKKLNSQVRDAYRLDE